MDDDAKFARMFGYKQGRTNAGLELRFRDANFIADLKARLSGLAARDNLARDSGWLMEFSPVQTDDLTERSIFQATLTSARHGERRMAFTLGRDWVEMGSGAMESSVRSSSSNVDAALTRAFHRVVLGWPYGTMDPAKVKLATA